MLKPKEGLYCLLFKRLNELKEKSRREIISFPDVFEKLCRNFSMTKKQAWEILFLLQDFGLVQVITGHGIKVNLPD